MSGAAVTLITNSGSGRLRTVTSGSFGPLDRVRPAAWRPAVPATLRSVLSRRSVRKSEGGCSR